MAEQLGEPPQILRGCGEQHLILGTAQAPQPKPVEPQDALHVREPHLDFLALAVRLLERFSVGENANVLSYVLVDIARDFAGRCCRAPRLELASRAVIHARPIR